MTFPLIPLVLAANLFGLDGDDPIARMAGVKSEEEVREEKQRQIKRELSDFTNAVVAIDYGTTREMYRLSRKGTNSWETSARFVFDLSQNPIDGYWNSLRMASGASGGQGFSGLRYENTILIAVPNGRGKRTADIENGDGGSSLLEVWGGVRSRHSNNTYSAWAGYGKDMLRWNNDGIETYFNWPVGGQTVMRKPNRLFSGLIHGLWVLRVTTPKGDQYWDFGYKAPPTIEEIRDELRRTVDEIKAGRGRKVWIDIRKGD